MTDYKSLIKKAMQASERAYSPYSHFKVGAVLVAKDGREYALSDACIAFLIKLL